MVTQSVPAQRTRHAEIPRPRTSHLPYGKQTKPNAPLGSGRTCEHVVPVEGPLAPGQARSVAECPRVALGTLPLIDPVTRKRNVWTWCSWNHRQALAVDLVMAGWDIPA
jgi:hypothetical protein